LKDYKLEGLIPIDVQTDGAGEYDDLNADNLLDDLLNDITN
jgi:hypothetical protein